MHSPPSSTAMTRASVGWKTKLSSLRSPRKIDTFGESFAGCRGNHSMSDSIASIGRVCEARYWCVHRFTCRSTKPSGFDAHTDGVDLVQLGDNLTHRGVELCPVLCGDASENPAPDTLHDVELGADDTGVPAYNVSLWDRDVRFCQPRHVRDLAFNYVRAGHQTTRIAARWS